MDGLVILGCIALFFMWIFGAFDNEEQKRGKLEKRRRNCKHNWISDSNAYSCRGRRPYICTKCGETNVETYRFDDSGY